MNRTHTAEIKARLRRCPVYAETPLQELPALASTCGVGRVQIKAEWGRMGLDSFKALGGGLAVALRASRHSTFVCASAGNHGQAVAAAARAFGRSAVVFLSRAVPQVFADRLISLGAQVERAGETYEESMMAARQAADRHGWELISDASWPGYSDPVLDVMRGYTILFEEAVARLEREASVPTHLFVQAGVGGLAAAGAVYLRDRVGEAIKIVVVEPVGAPSLFESAVAGRPVRTNAGGSRLGRLDCAEPSLMAFELLLALADAFLLVSDEAAIRAAERLSAEAAPASACGAAGAAGLIAASEDPEIAGRLRLDNSAQVLLIGTEAATASSPEPA